MAYGGPSLDFPFRKQHETGCPQPQRGSMRALLPPTSGDFSHPHLSPWADTRAALNCDLNVGNIVPGAFTAVLAQHSRSFSLEDALSFGVDRMQGNFDPMRQQVEH
jgi:hypothetical protein